MAAIGFLCGSISVGVATGQGMMDDAQKKSDERSKRGEEKDGNREIFQEGRGWGWKPVSRGALSNRRR